MPHGKSGSLRRMSEMCLLAKNFEKIAEEDIPCWKVLIQDKRGKWFTPYRGQRVFERVLSGEKLMRAMGIEGVYRLGNGYFRVGRGFVHSCASLEDAKSLGFVYIFECIIPKGTRYWTYYDGTEYASKTIRFVKKVG